MFSSIHEDAAMFSTKLSDASLAIANTVSDDPNISDCAGTTVPDPSAAVSTLTAVAAPGITVMIPDGVAARAPEVALMAADPVR
jgi:hypothetical protein